MAKKSKKDPMKNYRVDYSYKGRAGLLEVKYTFHFGKTLSVTAETTSTKKPALGFEYVAKPNINAIALESPEFRASLMVHRDGGFSVSKRGIFDLLNTTKNTLVFHGPNLAKIMFIDENGNEDPHGAAT